jgi:hypothetical protein
MALDGDDLRRLPLSMRKTNLARLLAQWPNGIFVAPFERGEIGPELFRAACCIGLEGVVSKRRHRPYRAGRSRDWIKMLWGGRAAMGCGTLGALSKSTNGAPTCRNLLRRAGPSPPSSRIARSSPVIRFHYGFQTAIKDGPAAPESAADAHDCIMVRSSKGPPDTRLRRDQRLIAGSPRISSPAPNASCTRDATLTSETTPSPFFGMRMIARHALRRQSRAPKGAPLRAPGIDRSARAKRGSFMTRMERSASPTLNQPERLWRKLPWQGKSQTR